MDKKIQTLKNYRQKILEGKVIKSLSYPKYVPITVRRIINKACNPDPDKRYKNSEEIRHALEKLKPNIDWFKDDECKWTGFCCATGKPYGISILKKKTSINVDLKKNNRRLTEFCKAFEKEKDAMEYLEAHISLTSYN